MGIGDAISDRRFVEIQARKVTGIGRIAQAQVNTVRAVVNGCLEGGQTSGGTDQVERSSFSEGGLRGHGTELNDSDVSTS